MVPENEGGQGRRDTFVGTALYVSPEMLEDNISKPASDLWALGCILFKMLSGTYPFEGSTENLTFTKIVERDFTMPEDISDEAKDLIDKLL